MRLLSLILFIQMSSLWAVKGDYLNPSLIPDSVCKIRMESIDGIRVGMCSAILINENYAITAKHCISEKQTINSNFLFSKRERSFISCRSSRDNSFTSSEFSVVHHDFVSLATDLALLKLDRRLDRVNINKVASVKRVKKILRNMERHKCAVVGYGRDNSDHSGTVHGVYIDKLIPSHNDFYHFIYKNVRDKVMKMYKKKSPWTRRAHEAHNVDRLIDSQSVVESIEYMSLFPGAFSMDNLQAANYVLKSHTNQNGMRAGTAQGDSGGALVCQRKFAGIKKADWEIVGMISYLKKNDFSKSYITPLIGRNKDWIESEMSGMDNDSFYHQFRNQ